MLKELSPTDKLRFNKLARHITQSWEWGEFRSLTPTVKKVVRLGSYASNKRGLRKVFQIFFHRMPYFPYTVAYLPRSNFPEAVELEELQKICRQERALFLKIEAFNNKSVVGRSSFVVEKPILPRHTIHIDLTISEKELLVQMHEKTRYNIRLAQKKGVLVKNENSIEALEHFINLLRDTESRQGFYSHSPDYYKVLWQTLRSAKMVYLLNAYIPLASSRSPLAASIMLFRFKDKLYYPYGGSNPEYRGYMAPHLLHWEAIKLGKKLGCKIYDLWGSYKEAPIESDPWWGIYRFKKGFGGKEVTFPETVDIPISRLYHAVILADRLRWFLLKLKP